MKNNTNRDGLKRNAQHYLALHQNGAGFHSDKRERRESGRNYSREYFEDYELYLQIRIEVADHVRSVEE